MIERGAANLRRPAGASLAVFVVAAATAFFLYPALFPPARSPEPTPQVAAGQPTTVRPQKRVEPDSQTPANQSSDTAVQRTPTESAPVVGALARPAAGRVLAGLGWRKDPVYLDWRYHGGVDLAAGSGENALSAWAGRVASVNRSADGCPGGGASAEVSLTHAGGWTSTYRIPGTALVAAGQRVDQGTPLISAGEGATALHFELRRHGAFVDPGWGGAE